MEHGPKEFIMLLLLLLLAPGMLLVLRPYRLAKKVAAKYRSLNDHAWILGVSIMLIGFIIGIIIGYEQTPFVLLFPPGVALAGILLTPLGFILLFFMLVATLGLVLGSKVSDKDKAYEQFIMPAQVAALFACLLVAASSVLGANINT